MAEAKLTPKGMTKATNVVSSEDKALLWSFLTGITNEASLMDEAILED